MQDDLPGYHLQRLIGGGGFGQVWLAWDDGPVGRPVAIKRLSPTNDPSASASLRVEAEVLASLDHPHILRILDVLDDPPGIALVLPYLAGGSLRGLLDERGTLGAAALVAVLAPLVDALTSLARYGLVHGDLKPDNILLTVDGEPVLADVGLARCLGRDASGPGAAGTPAYLDPAVAAGGPVGAASDVFSLGVLAYEALTGRLPHRGEPAETVAAARAGAHRPLGSWATVPAAMAAAVESAIEPDPANRPVTPALFLAAMQAAVDPAEIRLPGPCRAASVVKPLAGPPGYNTIQFDLAPLPATGVGPPTTQRGRRAAAIMAIVAAIAAAVVVAVSVAATSSGPTAQPCRQLPRPAAPGAAYSVDLDGDGCHEPARWDGKVLTVTAPSGVLAYAIGHGGDRLLAGDWDGDGTITPALYRPGSGEVVYVNRLPVEVGDRSAASRVDQVRAGGSAKVVRGADGRDRVQVMARRPR